MGELMQLDAARAAAAVEIGPQQYLTFDLGGEMFAVATRYVREIMEYGRLTTVPMMPAFICGVINLRGAVVPVIDLGVRFGGARTEINRRSCIVIVESVDGVGATQILGVVVDAVSEVLEIPSGDIEPAPAFGAKIRTDFIAGMGKVAGRFVILLNLGKVLSVDEIAAFTTVAAGPGTEAGAAG